MKQHKFQKVFLKIILPIVLIIGAFIALIIANFTLSKKEYDNNKYLAAAQEFSDDNFSSNFYNTFIYQEYAQYLPIQSPKLQNYLKNLGFSSRGDFFRKWYGDLKIKFTLESENGGDVNNSLIFLYKGNFYHVENDDSIGSLLSPTELKNDILPKLKSYTQSEKPGSNKKYTPTTNYKGELPKAISQLTYFLPSDLQKSYPTFNIPSTFSLFGYDLGTSKKLSTIVSVSLKFNIFENQLSVFSFSGLFFPKPNPSYIGTN